jgi:hypothetical protein
MYRAGYRIGKKTERESLYNLRSRIQKRTGGLLKFDGPCVDFFCGGFPGLSYNSRLSLLATSTTEGCVEWWRAAFPIAAARFLRGLSYCSNQLLQKAPTGAALLSLSLSLSHSAAEKYSLPSS